MERLAVFCIAAVCLSIFFAGCTSIPVVQPTPVPTSSANIVTVATPAQVQDPLLVGTWTLKSMVIQGGQSIVIPNADITATFDGQGNIYGYGGCNSYQGTYTLSGKQLYSGMGITIGPLAVTKKACPGTSDTETTYLQILQSATSYTVNNNGLTITNGANNMVVYSR